MGYLRVSAHHPMPRKWTERTYVEIGVPFKGFRSAGSGQGRKNRIGCLSRALAEMERALTSPLVHYLHFITSHILVFSADRWILWELNRKRWILGNHDSAKMPAVFMHACPPPPSSTCLPSPPQDTRTGPTTTQQSYHGRFRKILSDQMTRSIGIQKN